MLKPFAIVAALAGGISLSAQAQDNPVPERFLRMDRDGDGRISRAEWLGPENRFDFLDRDRDGFLSAGELPNPGSRAAADGRPAQGEPPSINRPAGIEHLIDGGEIRGPHRRAIASPGTSKADLRAAGMDMSGLVTVFPAGSRCYTIDHVFGEQWKGPADTLHSGADIPAPMNTPVLAMADGVVIYKTDGTDSGRKSRGTQVVLQHAPADTGLPFWLYTLYSHFNQMPAWEIGQRVRMGEVLGPNGRSGVPGAKREPHLHLTLLVSSSPRYGMLNGVVVPEFGKFIDPPAVFRGNLSVDTAEIQKIAPEERRVDVAVMYQDGRVSPAGSRVIWPFRCD